MQFCSKFIDYVNSDIQILWISDLFLRIVEYLTLPLSYLNFLKSTTNNIIFIINVNRNPNPVLSNCNLTNIYDIKHFSICKIQ
jgi:hypothetical protein